MPGCNIAPVLGGGYGPFCGTSSATPVVTGLAALTVSLDAGASPATVQQALTQTAVPLPGAVQYGRIDAARTLAVFHPAAAPVHSTQPAGLARSTVVARGTVGGRVAARRYKLPVGAGDLRVTLAYRGARLKLSLASPAAHVTGASPLRLARTVPRGPVTLVVAGGKARA